MTNLASTAAVERCASGLARTPTFDAVQGRLSTLGGLAVQRLLPRSRRRLVGPWWFLDSVRAGRRLDAPPFVARPGAI